MKKSYLFASLLILGGIAAISYVHAKIQSPQIQDSQKQSYSFKPTSSDFWEGSTPQRQTNDGPQAYSLSRDISLGEERPTWMMHEMSHTQQQNNYSKKQLNSKK